MRSVVETKLRRLARAGAAIAVASSIAAALGHAPALAATIGTEAAFQMSHGPDDHHTEAALGVASLDLGAADVMLGALRFDDDQVGAGAGLVFGGGLALAPAMRLRVLGTQFIGEDDFRALRLKVGPLWTSGRTSIGLFYTHDTSNLAPDAQGATTELGFPIAPRLAGKLGASYVSAEGASGYGGGAGLAWTLIPHLELSGELGLARNLAAAGAPASGVLTPLLGGGQESRPSDNLSPTTLLSVRVTFP